MVVVGRRENYKNSKEKGEKKMKRRTVVGCTVIGIAVILSVVIVTACITFASGYSIVDDFENGSLYTWENYAKSDGVLRIETDDTGNKYAKFVMTCAREQDYYDLSPKVEMVSNTTIQADFDIKYETIDTEKDEQVFFKYRTGSGSNETTIASRLEKHYHRLRYVSDGTWYNLKNPQGQDLEISAEKWYMVKMVTNLKDKWQSIYVFDKETSELLALTERVPLTQDISQINMISFTGKTPTYIDNLNINVVSSESSYITGLPYIQKDHNGTRVRNYYHLGLTYDNRTTSLNGNSTWSIVTETDGVTINPNNGKLTVTSSAPIRPIVIQAQYGEESTKRYIVNICD